MYSARYAGEGAPDSKKIEKLLSELENEDNRKAKFVTSMAFIFPDGNEIITMGEVYGKIIDAPRGDNGFGYDPVFLSDELNKTFAEATLQEKNEVSHRSRALAKLYDELSNVVDIGEL